MDEVRWGDESSEGTVVDDDLEVVDAPIPGAGYQYLHPFTVGGVTIATTGDFSYHVQDLYTLFMSINQSEAAETWWAELAYSMTNTSDPDDMDSAAFELMIALEDCEVSEGMFTSLMKVDIPKDSLTDAFAAESISQLETAMAELTLDVFENTPARTGFEVKSSNFQYPPFNQAPSPTIGPPLCPDIPDCSPLRLRLSCMKPTDDAIVYGETEWVDVLVKHDPNFPADKVDIYDDINTAASSRSNRRPPLRRCVHIVYEDGQCVNIGSHGYELTEDQDLLLDMTNLDIAIQELFAAPGGEGLTCPTPSHILHQLMCALLGQALIKYSPEIENQNIDLSVHNLHRSYPERVNFDLTTSAGIWNKKLSPDRVNPNFVYQAALSKYDLAAIFLPCLSDSGTKLLYRAVANSLSCEYPSYYRVEEDGLSQDMVLQSSIYSRLSSLSQRRIRSLAEMCYEAAITESQATLDSLDIHQQGTPWKAKRDIVLKSIQSKKPRKGIALPPVPLGEISALPDGPLSIHILGQSFQAGDYVIQGRGLGPSTHFDQQEHFLTHFPAMGIVDYESSQAIADILDETPLRTAGLSHGGPSRKYSGADSVYSLMASEAYQASAGAQLAEVRSDLARSIYKSPMPKKNVWVQVYLYLGKVCCWYRCRDDPSSADGYRIDWFAVSQFPVIGSIAICTDQGHTVQLWPRQRIRSQELQLAHCGPRRLKAVLYSALEKSNATKSDPVELVRAWERLVLTLNSSTYGSGEMFITCRFLSTTIATPSSPFDKMAKKLKDPKTFADVAYLRRLRKVMTDWVERSQYSDKCPLLGVPRAYSQLESYWMMWVPSEFADTSKNMSDCVMALFDEAAFLKKTEQDRVEDLKMQYDLLNDAHITIDKLRQSLRHSCALDTDGKLGWSWIGSLASGHALNTRGDASSFDRRFGKGTKARNITDHLTVRHSARIDRSGNIKKGTVAEMMLEQGIDDYLSTVDQTYRFLFIQRPIFFNHPKSGEHKPREISITDPDTRTCLSDAELICGLYGKCTRVDFLKDSAKNAKFYRTSSRVMTRGGGIQSSDATRYGPSMSNFAIAIMLLLLGTFSMHLKWASTVYARLAYRKMLLPTDIYPYLTKLAGHEDTHERAIGTLRWMRSMPVAAYEKGNAHVWYTTAHHMGQGMAHHSSSLLHAGGLILTVDAALRVDIYVSGQLVKFRAHIMVTSDDSTLVIEPMVSEDGMVLPRHHRQVAARIFLQIVREVRKIALRMVSVLPNLVKEIISSVKGEFNSQDTGIGGTCPILGFRELVSLIVVPSSPSLTGDYLNAFANAKDISLAGQGVSTGCFVHNLMIDSIEERWGLRTDERSRLASLNVLPNALTSGCVGTELLGSPAAMLDPALRAAMLSESIEVNAINEDLDPNTRDSVFASLMHVKVAMSRQHRNAIRVIKAKVKHLRNEKLSHQAQILEDSLRSTISSARTRNLGRVAFRIRTRNVCPRDYRNIKFERNSMIESTLNWLTYMNDKMAEKQPSALEVQRGNAMAGYIRVVSSQRNNFPRPPRIRRFSPPMSKKPRYMTSNYGKTPFGQHALTRSGTTIVESIGPAERESIQTHLAFVRHRKFSEHIEYGGSFVLSWSSLCGGIIVAIDLTNSLAEQLVEHVRKGDFTASGIAKLKELEEAADGIPVLAIQTYDGIRGLWHCIHKGQAYTVLYQLDLDVHTGDAIVHQTETGQKVLLACQGFNTETRWQDTVPQPLEVENYQLSDYYSPMPAIVRSVEDENITSGSVTAPTYSTVVRYMGEDSLVYISPEISATPRDNPALISRLPYLRAKVVASLSAGGYWHTSLRGVCFRAYLKGCFSGETVWTGGVIGWRQSSTSAPCYYSPVDRAYGVKALLVLGGYDDVDQVSRYNPDIHSKGYKAVCKSNTYTFQKAFKVDASYRDAILTNNNGQRYQTGDQKSGFLNLCLGEHPPPSGSIDPASAENHIIQKLMGQDTIAEW